MKYKGLEMISSPVSQRTWSPGPLSLENPKEIYLFKEMLSYKISSLESD
jgi:hypothetical protein